MFESITHIHIGIAIIIGLLAWIAYLLNDIRLILEGIGRYLLRKMGPTDRNDES